MHTSVMCCMVHVVSYISEYGVLKWLNRCVWAGLVMVCVGTCRCVSVYVAVTTQGNRKVHSPAFT